MAKRPTTKTKPAAHAPGAPPKAARANKHRGEVLMQLGPHEVVLCVNMNVLVDIEEAFGKPIAELGQALSKPSMKQVRTLVAALVRGGGSFLVDDGEGGKRPPTDEEVGAFGFDITAASAAIQQAFEAAGLFEVSADGELTSPQA